MLLQKKNCLLNKELTDDFCLSGRPPSSLPWGGGYPELREGPLRTGGMWLEGRRKVDGAEGLWRIHDELYDLSHWIHKHPGGSEWLTLTKVS